MTCEPQPTASPFPVDRWWAAGFAWEFDRQPLIARTILSRPMVLFRTPDGRLAALEDRCCHKELPLSCGSVEGRGLRCGYHGLLYDTTGACIEVPGQDRIPQKAQVPSYPLRERDRVLWVWIGSEPASQPNVEPPAYPFHLDPGYAFGGDVYHYDAPYQLIHDNLLDLSHLGYVHLKTIGGNPAIHMNAEMKVEVADESVRVVRTMRRSVPPPTYSDLWPFEGPVDRWQEVEFRVSHLLIWAGAMDAGSGRLDDPHRRGLHIRGFHGVTPETQATTHYFWTVGTNPHPERSHAKQAVVEQSAATFMEDKAVIEAQWRNQRRFAGRRQIDIHVDQAPNRARRLIQQMLAVQ